MDDASLRLMQQWSSMAPKRRFARNAAAAALSLALAGAVGVQGPGGRAAAAPSPAAPTVPDDSPAARDAAIARLRAAPARPVCADPSAMSRVYGTSCNSREFPAPPILAAPRVAWEAKPGWWSVWSPFLVGRLVLTGSCNNDTNAGLSALDMATGKIVWRIASICDVGGRRGSMGSVAFHELPSGEVLMIYPRQSGQPTDFYVIDPKAGRIVRSLTPAANVALRSQGAFTGVSQSNRDGVSYITGLSPALDKVLWRNGGFRLAMAKDDPRYLPTFSPPAADGGVLFQTARSKDQADPPTRQLHAIDLHTGQTLWRHTDQPVAERGNGSAWRSDDGTPMVAGGKVIVPVQGLLGPAAYGRKPDGDALRALDPRSGAVLWTSRPVAGATIADYVAAGDVLVAEVDRGGMRELWGFRLADGGLAWRRPAGKEVRVLASSGGVAYLSERVPGAGGYDFRVQGLDGQTGVLLWTTVLPGHDNPFDSQWGVVPDLRAGGVQGPAWRIGRDGAIYGILLNGAYKLQ
ncbi:MAG: PQQ-binding-like beta-propeller repeat protein [Phenylobacterium sp.]|nr:PQQ-binding-like beta-propeller repeat protein [Phenylobacterium sp.]